MHVGIAHPRWQGKRSRHSRRMHNPQFYVSIKRPIPMRWLPGSHLIQNKRPRIQHFIIWPDLMPFTKAIKLPFHILLRNGVRWITDWPKRCYLQPWFSELHLVPKQCALSLGHPGAYRHRRLPAYYIPRLGRLPRLYWRLRTCVHWCLGWFCVSALAWIYRWLCAWLQYIQCASNGDTATLR